MYSCIHCSQQFKSSQSLNSHQKAHSTTKHTLGYVLGAGKYKKEQKNNRLKLYNTDPKHCMYCANVLPLGNDINVRKFCNRSCSAKYNNKLRCKNVESRDLPFVNTCLQCNNQFNAKMKKVKFCSDSCRSTHRSHNPRELTEELLSKLRKGGQRSALAQSASRRSVNEQLFYDLCLGLYTNIECNVCFFNGWDADVILHDERVAVLWNGKWHYVQLNKKHSVAQVQNRDKIKVKEIIKTGYIPYIIQDLGRPGKKANIKFVNDQFQLFKYWLNQLHVNTAVY